MNPDATVERNEVSMRRGVRAFSRTAARAARNRAGLTQADAAAIIGVTDGIVSAWESGTRAPGPRNLVALATSLGVDAAELINLADDDRRLADIRAISGLSGGDVAERLEISATSLYDVERGDQRPSAQLQARLAALYGVGEGVIEDAWVRSRSARLAAIPAHHHKPPT